MAVDTSENYSGLLPCSELKLLKNFSVQFCDCFKNVHLLGQKVFPNLEEKPKQIDWAFQIVPFPKTFLSKESSAFLDPRNAAQW